MDLILASFSRTRLPFPNTAFILLVLGTLALVGASPAGAPPSAKPPSAGPEDLGFSSERLTRLDHAMEQLVHERQFAGMVFAVARHGKTVDLKTYGEQNSSGTPMKQDAIFRIFSMTKPVTAVAMMILYEEGKWNPNDPIAKYIPEFKSVKVFKDVDSAGAPILVDPIHPPTVGELMTHTAGLTYGIFGDTPVDKMYVQKNVFNSSSLREFTGKVASLPLLYQPGTRWVYSVSVDVQGYLVEKLSGEPLPQFMRERIFTPLGMNDTGFSVPPEKAGRLASLYKANEQGVLAESVGFGQDFTKQPPFASGGGGLVSTEADYLRFAQMLLNNGELQGVRILAPSSVKLMSSNHLAPSLMTGEWGIGVQRIRPGFGYGYDVAVFTNPAEAGSTIGTGSFLWDGAAGTWFWVDPANDIVFVGMVQRMMDAHSPNVQNLSRALTYGALLHPEK